MPQIVYPVQQFIALPPDSIENLGLFAEKSISSNKVYAIKLTGS